MESPWFLGRSYFSNKIQSITSSSSSNNTHLVFPKQTAVYKCLSVYETICFSLSAFCGQVGYVRMLSGHWAITQCRATQTGLLCLLLNETCSWGILSSTGLRHYAGLRHDNSKNMEENMEEKKRILYISVVFPSFSRDKGDSVCTQGWWADHMG